MRGLTSWVRSGNGVRTSGNWAGSSPHFFQCSLLILGILVAIRAFQRKFRAENPTTSERLIELFCEFSNSGSI